MRFATGTLASIAALVVASAGTGATAPVQPTGTVDSFQVTADVLGGTVWVPVSVPATGADERLPTIYVGQRGVYFDRIPVHRLLDSLAAGARAIVVGIPDPAALDGFRPGSDPADSYVEFIARELVPAVEARFPARRAASGRLLLGFSAGANVLADLAVREPQLFGRAALVSPGWMFRSDGGRIGEVFIDDALAQIDSASKTAAQRPELWFVWGDGPSDWEARSRESGERYVDVTRRQGFPVTHAGTVPGDHGLALAGDALREALRFLLLPPRAEREAPARRDAQLSGGSVTDER